MREADAVYSNLRGDQPAKLRITYEDLRELNPRIVCCSLSGFGNTGPRSAEPAYDYILQAHDRLDEPDRGAGRAAGEVRALARGLLGRVRERAGVGRGCVAGAARRGRLRLRHLAVRDRALAAHLRRDVGRDEGARDRAASRVRAPLDRAVPGVPDRGRLGHGGVREAEVLARAVRGARAGAGGGRALRGLRRARRAPRRAARAAAASLPGGVDGGADREAGRGGRPVRAGQRRAGRARGPAGRRARRDRRLRASAAGGGTAARLAASARRRYRPAPARGEDTEVLLRELCGYDDAKLRQARAAGAFGT